MRKMIILKNKRMGAVLVFIMIIALLLSPMFDPNVVDADTGSHDQVGSNYYFLDEEDELIDSTATGNSLQTTRGGTGNKLFVDYSKSIEATATPDQFDITLKVKTNEDLDKIYKPSNIMIVFDVSLSMDTSIFVDGQSTTRWEIFKKAIEDFITDFLGENPGNNVAISVFGGRGTRGSNDYKPICDWTNNAEDAIETFDYNQLSRFRENVGEWTNGEAGFTAAYEKLKGGAYQDKYTSVILVSDGLFNTCYDDRKNKGVNDTSEALQDAAISAAKKLSETSGCDDIYTFAMGNDAGKSKAMSPGVKKNPYLKDLLVAGSDEDIGDVFQGLYDYIQRSVQPWKVIDPMSNWVDYVGGSISISPTQTYGVGDLVSTSNNAITWDLKKTTPLTEGTAPNRTFAYSLKYTVILDRSAVGAANRWDEYLPTNKDTILEYAYSHSPETTLREHFLIPTVIAPDPTPPTGNVEISKTVTGTGAPSGDTFDFRVWVAGELYDGEYFLNGTSGTMEDGKLTLGDGDKAIINDLTVGTDVEVLETPKAYYTSQGGDTKTGEIVEGETIEIPFTNNYAKAAGLTAEKSSNPESGSVVERGDFIVYKIKVTNGDELVTATGVVIKDFIPANTEFSEVHDGGIYNSSENYVTWYVDEIAPGDFVEVSFKVTIPDDFDENIENIGLYKQTGEITSEAAFNNEDNFGKTNKTIHIPPQPSMEISKSNTPGEGEIVGQGEDIVYQIKVENDGNVPLYNVWVRDYIPTYTTYKTGSVSDNGIYNDTDKFVQWLIPSIGVGESETVNFTVVVNEDASDVTIQNVGLAEILGVDTTPPTDRDPGNNTNIVTNNTPVVEGEEEFPPDDEGDVMGESADPPVEQKVLGEEAKTSDSMNLTILIIVGIAVMLALAALAMRRRESEVK